MPLPRGNKISDNKRRSNNKYDSAHYTTIAAKIRNEEANKFKEYCKRRGMTVNAVISEFVLSCISEEDSTVNNVSIENDRALLDELSD